jgi:hypothetical protein
MKVITYFWAEYMDAAHGGGSAITSHLVTMGWMHYCYEDHMHYVQKISHSNEM